MLERIEGYLKSIVEAIEAIKKVLYVITHPIIIWNWFISVAYWIAVLLCVFCIIYYAATGSHKPARVMWVTIVTFILLKGVDMII